MWEYEVIKYDAMTKSGGLFDEHINKFLKLKVESTGWRSWCIDKTSRALYINQFFEREGVYLDADKMTPNSGRRFLSKLMLNSLWGKFGQRENKSQVIINSYSELVLKLLNENIEVESFTPINDETLLLSFKIKEETSEHLNHVNVVVAAYTTA